MAQRTRKPAAPAAPAAPAEWVGGTFAAPATVTGEGEPYRPDALLWVDPGAELVVGFAIAHPDDLPGLVVENLRETIARPIMGPPGPPARLRVATDELADRLRAGFPDIELVVAPTPELDAVGANLAGVLAAGPPDAGWLGEGFEAAAVAGFFDAMAALWRAAPWDVVPDEDALVSVTVEALDVRDAVAVVIGRMGESFGVLLFDGAADRDRYVEIGEAMRRGDVHEAARLGGEAGMPAHTGLSFDPVDDLAPVRVAERDEHGWALADERAFPSLLCAAPDLQPRPPTATDLALGEAVARAFALASADAGFVAAWEAAYGDDEPFERTLRVPVHGGPVDVRLSVPVEADDGVPSRDPDAIPERVYRLKLELEHVDPDWPDREVSRTVELAGDHTLWDLHHVIQDAFDWDDDHLFDFFVSGKLRDRKRQYTGLPLGDVESWSWDDEEERSVTGTTLDELALKPRRVMRYVFDGEWLVRIGVSTIRDGGPDDAGLPRRVASVGAAPPQYESSEDWD